MQTIGERLEEARKKHGLTLQEAATATKIRAEYLGHLERNQLEEIPLETIYVRGFIKSYAKTLRMDPNRLLADFDAMERSKEPSAVKSNKELIGRLELGAEPPAAPTLPNAGDAPANVAVESSAPAAKPSLNLLSKEFPQWTWPAIVGIVALFILAGIVVGVMSFISSSSKPAATTVATTQIKLVALNDVTIIVRETQTEETLFSGTLKKGEEKLIDRKGAVRLQFSDGTALEVEKEGKRFKMGTNGAGKRLVD